MNSVLTALILFTVLAKAQTLSEEEPPADEAGMIDWDAEAEALATKQDEMWNEWEKEIETIEGREDLGEDEKYD